mmetsp:Transcript_17330/g.37715  ORF Transcript_17330/g.37715 Transcript_17330/m.37715 type:complete len:341 (-) Transcript_17330:273-1295(-)
MGKPKKRTRGTEQEAAEEAEQAAADIGKGKSARVEEPSKEPDEGSDSDSEDYDVSTDDAGSSDEEEDSEDSQEEEEDKEEIDVDFDFFDPKPEDFHGVRALLNTYLDDKAFPGLSDFVDTIIEQTTVGTIVRTSESESAVGLITALNLHEKRNLGCIKEISAYLLEKCPADTKDKLSQALSGRKTALMINERLVNCPPQLANPLTTALFDEIAWATEDEPTQERRDEFEFDQYLVFTRAFRDPLVGEGGGAAASASGANKKSKQPKKEKQKAAAPDESALVFTRPEDEIFHQLSAWSFVYNAERSQNASGNELKPVRIVYLLDAKKVPEGRKRIKALVDV